MLNIISALGWEFYDESTKRNDNSNFGDSLSVAPMLMSSLMMKSKLSTNVLWDFRYTATRYINKMGNDNIHSHVKIWLGLRLKALSNIGMGACQLYDKFNKDKDLNIVKDMVQFLKDDVSISNTITPVCYDNVMWNAHNSMVVYKNGSGTMVLINLLTNGITTPYNHKWLGIISDKDDNMYYKYMDNEAYIKSNLKHIDITKLEQLYNKINNKDNIIGSSICDRGKCKSFFDIIIYTCLWDMYGECDKCIHDVLKRSEDWGADYTMSVKEPNPNVHVVIRAYDDGWQVWDWMKHEENCRREFNKRLQYDEARMAALYNDINNKHAELRFRSKYKFSENDKNIKHMLKVINSVNCYTKADHIKLLNEC